MPVSRRALMAALPALATSSKGQPKSPVMGRGKYTYEVTHDWPRLPATLKFGNTHGIVADSQGRLIVCHTVHKTSESGDAIAIFDADGKFVKSWGSDMRGGAHGLTLRKEGDEEFLYHCDNVKGYVRKTTLDGEVVWILQCPFMSGLYKTAKEYKPSNLAIAPNGDIYVADGYGKFYIHHYDSKTRYVRSFGGSRELMNADPAKETAPGTTIWPHAIAIDLRGAEPLLMVGERGANSRIQYFTLEGKPLHSLKNGVRWPSIFEFRNGVVLMPDLKAVVTLFDSSNNPIVQLGDGRQPDGKTYEGIRDKPPSAFTAGQFIAPHGACFDADGNIFVTEWVEYGRVSKLRRVA
jgi:outer membrane protein assembly factor BamB